MTAPPTPVGGTTPAGVPYPAITGPKPYNDQITDIAAIAAEGVEDLTEEVLKIVGPTSTVVVGVLNDFPTILGLLLQIRDPLNGKNLTRVSECQQAYAANNATGLATLIGRYNAEPLEPNWMRQLCQFYAVLRGVPASAFPS